MTDEQLDRLEEVIDGAERTHYRYKNRHITRVTEEPNGYIICTHVTIAGDEDLDEESAMRKLDEKERDYFEKLVRWGVV